MVAGNHNRLDAGFAAGGNGRFCFRPRRVDHADKPKKGQAIFQFIASWNNLFTPTLILSSDAKKTLPMFVQILKSDQFRTDYGMVYLGLAATILPLFVVYFLLCLTPAALDLAAARQWRQIEKEVRR